MLDDPWYPDYKYTNEDDWCALLVHGWELAWYWGEDWQDSGDPVSVWFSRETG